MIPVPQEAAAVLHSQKNARLHVLWRRARVSFSYGLTLLAGALHLSDTP